MTIECVFVFPQVLEIIIVLKGKGGTPSDFCYGIEGRDLYE